MNRADLQYLIEARYRTPMLEYPGTHYAMSLETLRDVAEGCAVELPEDWKPGPSESQPQIMGIPVELDGTMPRGAWAIHVACSPHGAWPGDTRAGIAKDLRTAVSSGSITCIRYA